MRRQRRSIAALGLGSGAWGLTLLVGVALTACRAGPAPASASAATAPRCCSTSCTATGPVAPPLDLPAGYRAQVLATLKSRAAAPGTRPAPELPALLRAQEQRLRLLAWSLIQAPQSRYSARGDDDELRALHRTILVALSDDDPEALAASRAAWASLMWYLAESAIAGVSPAWSPTDPLVVELREQLPGFFADERGFCELPNGPLSEAQRHGLFLQRLGVQQYLTVFMAQSHLDLPQVPRPLLKRWDAAAWELLQRVQASGAVPYYELDLLLHEGYARGAALTAEAPPRLSAAQAAAAIAVWEHAVQADEPALAPADWLRRRQALMQTQAVLRGAHRCHPQLRQIHHAITCVLGREAPQAVEHLASLQRLSATAAHERYSHPASRLGEQCLSAAFAGKP